MARPINKVDFSGFLSDDPKLEYIASGKAVTRLRIGIPEEHKNQQTGEKQTTWTNLTVTFWEKAAEIVCQYGQKGSEILVTNSRLKSSRWEDKEGNKRESLDLVGGDFRFLGAKPQSQPQEGYQRQSVAKNNAAPAREPVASSFSDDDVPF